MTPGQRGIPCHRLETTHPMTSPQRSCVPFGTLTGMAMQTIHHELRSPTSPSDVYRLLADSMTWPSWTPITHCEITQTEAPGRLEERIFTNGRHRVHERVVEKSPDTCVAYTLLGGLAIKDYLARITLAAVPGGTIITWHTTFRPKVPGTGRLYRRALDAATAEFVSGLAKEAAKRGT